jgi:NADP-dependent 3-hydroxy acid dehydrogenase YdfG
MLINVAGIVDYAPVAEVDLVSWQRTMGVDPDGVMLGMWAMIN